MALFFFHGQEEYLMNKEIKRLRNELLDASFASMAYKVFYNPTFADLIACLQSAPLMFGNTLSLIHLDKYLVGAKLSFDDKQIECIDKALSNIQDSVNIIFLCKIPRDENKKPDSRKKLYKTISKYAAIREFAQIPAYKSELNTQIAGMAKEKEFSVNPDAVRLLIEQVGNNLTLIDSELEKLKVAIYPSTAADKKSVSKYCTSSEDIFTLADLIVSGNKNEVLKQLDLLTEKRHPLEIFAFLQNNFQKFIYIKNYSNKMSAKDISQKLKLHEYIVKLTSEKLSKVTMSDLIKIRKNLIEAEYKMKSGYAAGDNILMESAILG